MSLAVLKSTYGPKGIKIIFFIYTQLFWHFWRVKEWGKSSFSLLLYVQNSVEENIAVQKAIQLTQ